MGTGVFSVPFFMCFHMIKDYNFSLYQGTDFSLVVNLLNDGKPSNLEGFKVACQIEKSYFKDKIPVAELNTENGRILIEGSKLIFKFDNKLTKSIPAGTYRYDVLVISPEDFRTLVLSGEIKSKEVITDVPDGGN